AQAVGCGDLTEGIGIVHYWSEKVHRLHQGALVADLYDPRIVRFRQSDEDVGALFFTGQVAENVRQVLRTQFAPSPRFGGKLGQANRFPIHRATSSLPGGNSPSIISDYIRSGGASGNPSSPSPAERIPLIRVIMGIKMKSIAHDLKF